MGSVTFSLLWHGPTSCGIRKEGEIKGLGVFIDGISSKYAEISLQIRGWEKQPLCFHSSSKHEISCDIENLKNIQIVVRVFHRCAVRSRVAKNGGGGLSSRERVTSIPIPIVPFSQFTPQTSYELTIHNVDNHLFANWTKKGKDTRLNIVELPTDYVVEENEFNRLDQLNFLQLVAEENRLFQEKMERNNQNPGELMKINLLLAKIAYLKANSVA